MLELLGVLAVVAYLLFKLEPKSADHGTPAAAPASLPRARAERPRPRLIIAGTQRAHLRSNKFMKRFGVAPHAVHDIRMYTEFGPLEEFPSVVAMGLKDLYARGCAVGADIMALLWHGRELKEGEAVYFALIEAKPEPRVIAFVDKLRLS